MRNKLLLGTSVAALSLGAAAVPAEAARQDGLVNVYAENTTVQVPIGVAANVCGVAVNVLANVADFDSVTCTATGVATADNEPRGGGGNVRQSGLVNLALVDTTVQVPVAVAANICGVSVNILASVLDAPSQTLCDAAAEAAANA